MKLSHDSLLFERARAQDLKPRQDGRRASWSINLLRASLGHGYFLEFIVERVQGAPMPAEILGFEITETEAIGNLEEALLFIAAMKREGSSFFLDDFGTGVYHRIIR